jgi:hypothetical protein
VGLRAVLDRCGKSRLHQDLILGPSSLYPVAVPTELPGPRVSCSQGIDSGSGLAREPNPRLIMMEKRND